MKFHKIRRIADEVAVRQADATRNSTMVVDVLHATMTPSRIATMFTSRLLIFWGFVP